MTITRRKRRRFTVEQRQDYIARFGRSGLSASEFCRREQLHAATFSLWRQRTKTSSAPAFAEVHVAAPAPALTNSAAVLVLPCGARLELALDGDASWHGLGVLLKSLQS